MSRLLIVYALAILSLGLEAPPGLAVRAPRPLQLVATIALPHVPGRIDHFSMDVRGQRLFIAALGNHTLEVVDLKTDRWLRSLPGVN